MIKELTHILGAVGLVNALVYSVVFANKLKSRRHFAYLIPFLLAYALPFLPHMFNHYQLTEGRPQLLYFPFVFQFAYPALYYLLATSTVRDIKKTELLHLLPGIFEFLVFTFFSLSSSEFIASLGEGWKRQTVVFVYNWVVPAYVSFYCILTIKNVRWLQLQLPKYYSETNRTLFTWFQVGAILLISDEVVHLISRNSLFLSGYVSTHLLISTLVSLAVIFWASITGGSIPKYVIEPSLANKKPSPTIGQDEALFKNIVDHISSTKAYTKTNYSIYDLSNELNIPFKRVSAQINSFANVNFNQFINEKRVEDAKVLLKDEQYNKYSLEAIGEEVGFSSKSSFYRAFKKHTGFTPNEFKSQNM